MEVGENTKKVVVVSLSVRYQLEEHELFPTYGQLYQQGYTHADRGVENLFLLTEPLPGGNASLGDNELLDLHNLGYEVCYLAPTYTAEDTLSHLELVVWNPTQS